MELKTDRYAGRLSGLLVAGGLLAVGAMIAALLIASTIVNRISLTWEEDQLRHGLESRIVELQALVVPQVDWDDAVTNLDLKFNPEWAKSNLGAYLTQTAGFDRVYLVDAAGRWTYAKRADDAQTAQADAATRASVAPLVDRLRSAEAARGPFRTQGVSSSMISKPIQASAIVRLDGSPWILTATLVQPDFGSALPRTFAPVVITGREVDADFVAEMARRYQLSDARLIKVAGSHAQGLAHAPLLGPDGRAVGEMSWSPRRPGAALLQVAWLPLLVALALVAGVILLLRRSSLRLLAELMQVQEELRETARRAEAANKAKSEFLANVSHEIRTPLNGVVGVAELLARSSLDPDQTQLVETIRASGVTLDRLLMDVLDISKMEAGRLSVCREPFDLHRELQSIEALWRPRAEQRGLQFTCDLEAGRGVVLGDAVRLRQILSNLLSNAIKFTESGTVSLRLVRDADRYAFTVTDTGIGFDEETKARLFGRFEQADGGITRRFGGTGLGLSISRNLVTLLQGSLDCESKPGKGASFTAVLPLPPAKVVMTQPSEDARDHGLLRNIAVLAADDHNINRKVLKLALESFGAQVTLVTNGIEAVEAFQVGSYDLVLMDMQMPGMDGLSATREIRRLEAASGRARTPILMLTANAGEAHELAGADAGADGHVTKPLKPDALCRAIERVRLRLKAVA